MTQAIEITNYSYRYSDGIEALAGITLNIAPGERVALIGPNGAGKSTLLLAINGFLKGAGSVTIDGLEHNKANTKKIRARLALVSQNPDDQLFMPTLFEDVAFGPLNMGINESDIPALVEKTLQKVGLAGLGHRPSHHFSAGQKRAAAIATVLSMSPAIITMDEPDANLDPRNRDNILAILNALTQTLVVATCSMDFVARLCTRSILIDSGKVIADGNTKELLTNTTLMRSHGLETPAYYFTHSDRFIV